MKLYRITINGLFANPTYYIVSNTLKEAVAYVENNLPTRIEDVRLISDKVFVIENNDE